MVLNLVKSFEILELLKSSTHSENTTVSHSDLCPETWTGVLELGVKTAHNLSLILSHVHTQILTLHPLQEGQDRRSIWHTFPPISNMYLHVYLEITAENIQKLNVIVLS